MSEDILIRRITWRALSIRQPWAWAITHAGKRIENRNWSTAYRGPFLVHASKGCTRAEYDGAVQHMREVCCVGEVPPLEALARGAIVGLATLVDVRPNRESDGPWAMLGAYGFHLLARVLPITPISCSGSLGWWAPTLATKSHVVQDLMSRYGAIGAL